MANTISFHEILEEFRINCGPLSDTSCWGSYMHAKMMRSCVTISSAVVLVICIISGHLLYASITSRYMILSNGLQSLRSVAATRMLEIPTDAEELFLANLLSLFDNPCNRVRESQCLRQYLAT